MNDGKIFQLTKAAMLAALTAVATLVIQIPIPGTGYINLGDGLVLLSGFLLGPLYGGLAAGIGAGLADLISGYAIYAPATFVIKALCAASASYLFTLLDRKNNKTQAPIGKYVVFNTVFSGIISELIMVLGYFLYEGFVVLRSEGGLAASFGAAALGVPFNLIQGVCGVIVAILLYPVVRRLFVKGGTVD